MIILDLFFDSVVGSKAEYFSIIDRKIGVQ